MKKILYIIGFYPNNPRNIKMINYLKNRYEVKCCYWNTENIELLEEDKNNFIFSKNKIRGKIKKILNILFYGLYIKKIIKKYKPDCIFLYHWDIFILTRVMTIFNKKIKIVYDISDIPAYTGIIHTLIKRIEEFFISEDIYLMFASKYFQEKYKKFKKNRKIVINNKPELKFLKSYNENKIETDDIIVSFFGVFRDYEVFKNIFIAAENLPIKLKLYGDGFEKNKIKEYAKKFENILIGTEFTPKDLPILYQDVSVILSLYSNKDENTKLAIGNKFFESLVLKKVALFPKNTKMGDYICKRKLGYVVDPYDSDEIRKAFISIINKDEKNKIINKNLLNLKEEELFYEHEVNIFLPELEKFLNKKC